MSQILAWEAKKVVEYNKNNNNNVISTDLSFFLGIAVSWADVKIWWNGIWAGYHQRGAASPQQRSGQGFGGPDGSCHS